MNLSVRSLVVFTILPLFMIGIGTGYFTDADALRGQGVPRLTVGSDSEICGLQLCSDIPGGKDGWLKQHMDDDDHDTKDKTKHSEKSDHMDGDKKYDKDEKHMDGDKKYDKDEKHMDGDKKYDKDEKHMDGDKKYDKDEKHMDGDKKYDKDEKHMDGDKKYDKDEKHMDGDKKYDKDEKHMDGDKKYDKDEKHMDGDKKYDKDEKHMDGDKKYDKDEKHMDGDKKYDKDEKHMDGDKKSYHAKYYTPSLNLARANVLVDIPLHTGFYNGQDVHYIITDSSDLEHADLITSKQGWRVEHAPFLANAPEDALSKTFIFVNGIEGKGMFGYQSSVFTSTPAQPDMYSALAVHTHVEWVEGVTPTILDSEGAIVTAAEHGDIILTDLNSVVNMPHIVWPDGHMMVKENTEITDESPYGGGQVVDIDLEEMSVTFVAHRGWASDGRTIYYIVTDATPGAAANMMGVVDSPTSASLIVNSAAVDLFQFKNGIKGTGPLGFQPGIASGAPGDENYSPMWRIFLIEWNDPMQAQLLETLDDINAYFESDMITISIARPADSDHIVNCPFIDPFQ